MWALSIMEKELTVWEQFTRDSSGLLGHTQPVEKPNVVAFYPQKTPPSCSKGCQQHRRLTASCGCDKVARLFAG